MRALFLQAPSFDGYDGGAGARYQMKREVKSFWFPTWLGAGRRDGALAPRSSTRRRTACPSRTSRTT